MSIIMRLHPVRTYYASHRHRLQQLYSAHTARTHTHTHSRHSLTTLTHVTRYTFTLIAYCSIIQFPQISIYAPFVCERRLFSPVSFVFAEHFNSIFSRLNFYLFGLKPIWFHLTNILMHAIVCVLFTRVCIIVAGLKNNFAIIAGIMFAVHPIHTEAVSVCILYYYIIYDYVFDTIRYDMCDACIRCSTRPDIAGARSFLLLYIVLCSKFITDSHSDMRRKRAIKCKLI